MLNIIPYPNWISSTHHLCRAAGVVLLDDEAEAALRVPAFQASCGAPGIVLDVPQTEAGGGRENGEKSWELNDFTMKNDGNMMKNDGKWWQMMENDGTWWKMMEHGDLKPEKWWEHKDLKQENREI